MSSEQAHGAMNWTWAPARRGLQMSSARTYSALHWTPERMSNQDVIQRKKLRTLYGWATREPGSLLLNNTCSVVRRLTTGTRTVPYTGIRRYGGQYGGIVSCNVAPRIVIGQPVVR